MLGGDPEALRAAARRLRTHADRLDGTTQRLRDGHALDWRGTAADSFRHRLAREVQGVESTRESILTAAASMDSLADELAARQAAIRRAMEQVDEAVDSAVSTVNGLAHRAWDALTGTERAAEEQARSVLATVGSTLPPPGHPDYLDLARRLGGGR